MKGKAMSAAEKYSLIIFAFLMSDPTCAVEKHNSDTYSLEVSSSNPVKVDYENNAIRTTICEVNNSEELFLGKQLILSAIYETNMRHGAFLRDESCKQVSYRVGYYNENIDESILKFNEAQNIKFNKPLEFRVVNVQIIGQLIVDNSESSDSKKNYDIRILKIVSYSYPETN